MKRYIKNMNMLSKEENESLSKYKVCVIGCGGLGGYIIEMLSRLGIGTITAVDGDVFDESNLNRQLLSDSDSIGKHKALKAKERINLVNENVNIIPKVEKLTEENALDIFKGHDVIVDATDNIDTRFIIEKNASILGIPMVHGAIAGWYGQVTTIFPGDNTLDKIYPDKKVKGLERELGNPSFTPALVASIQVSEVLKILIKRGNLLRNKLLYIDLLEQNYMEIDL